MQDPETEAALDALADVLSTLAHDLNQPLAAAGNYLSAARRMARRLGASDLEEALEKAAAQLVRASQSVQKARASFGTGETQRARESLHDLIRRAFAGNARLPAVGATLHLNAADDAVLVDAPRVMDAFVHLARALAGNGEAALTLATSSDVERIHVEIVGTDPGVEDCSLTETAPVSPLAYAIARRIFTIHDGSITVRKLDADRVGVQVRLPLAGAGGDVGED